ncbi:exotoxin OB-fold domain-containing protein [Staphylococcus aureus]
MDNSTVISEFRNVDDVKKFKNHAVDVYGLSYSGYCLKNKYIYGGVTLAGDYLEKSWMILPSIFGLMENIKLYLLTKYQLIKS